MPQQPGHAHTPAARLTQVERSALAEEKMIEATIELLNTVGLSGATLIAIGRHAGYSRGLASHHFGSKSNLFRKVLKHISAAWARELGQWVAEKKGLAAILAALDAHREHVLRYPKNARAMHVLWGSSFDPASKFKPNVAEFHRLQCAAASAWVVEGQRAGEIRSDVGPEEFGEQFYASIIGLDHLWLVSPEIDFVNAIEVLKQNVVSLIRV